MTLGWDIEKGAGASHPSILQHPRLTNPNDFPPTYEQHVNDNMRNFGEGDFHDVKLQEFDDIEQPSKPQRKRKCPTWVWFTIGLSMVIIVAALLGGVIIHYTNKQDSHGEKVPIAPVRPISSSAAETKLLTQTPMHTRSEETTTVSPVTTTIFVTETPPTTSTQVTTLTLTLSTSTPSIVTVTSTSTASSTSTTSTVSFAPPLTINPTSSALSASISAELSRSSESEAEASTPPPVTTTLMSVTTATSVSISTPPPEPSPTIVPMPGGQIDWCGVPGTSCNE